MKIKFERLFFLLIYSGCNVLAVSIYFITGKIGGDLRGISLDEPFFLLVSLFVVLISLVFTHVVFVFFERFIPVKPIVFYSVRYRYFDLFFILLIISYTFFSAYYDVGKAGVKLDENTPKVVLYFFIILQPIFLSYIYLAFTGDKKRKSWNIVLFLVLLSTVMNGWLSGILYLLFIWMMFNSDWLRKNKLKVIGFTLLGIFLAPVLKLVKSVVSVVNNSSSGIEVTQALNNVLAYRKIDSFGDFFLLYAGAVVERFEHSSIIYYAFVNDNFSGYLTNKVTPFFAEGWLQDRLYKALTGSDTIDLQVQLAQQLFSNYEWRVNTPISLWMTLDIGTAIGVIIYSTVLLFISSVLSRLINPNVTRLTWLMTIIMLWHGWFYSFTLYIQALFIFVCGLLLYRLMFTLREYEYGK